GAELGDRLIVAARNRLRCRPAAGKLGQNFLKRHQVRYGAGARRRQRLVLAAVGEHLDAMLDADRQRLAPDRTTAAMRERFLRGKPHLAFAMTVEMIFALIGKKFDRPDIAATALQGVLDGEIVELAVKRRGLASQLAGRMGVGVRGEAVAVEE